MVGLFCYAAVAALLCGAARNLRRRATLRTYLAFIITMNQQQLIKECRQGSSAAQQCLFDHFASHMMMICCRYVKNEQDAEEIVLNGFYKFFTSLHHFQYKGEAALFAWVKKIMINECLMFLRKKNALQMTSESGAEQVPVQEETLAKLDAADIFNMIVQLPVGYRTVFNLHSIEGMSHKEIAKLLHITEGTSKSQLAKARQLLQKILLQKNDYVDRKAK
jgi:RNA polymerase sigma factor (sigma-70 family)